MADIEDRLRPPPATRMAGPVQHLDLHASLAELRREPRLATGSWRSVTLVHRDTLRVVLIAFDKGAHMPSHDAPGPVLLQVLRGKLRVGLPDGDVVVDAGELLALETALPHDVEALEESDLLLGVHPLAPHSPPTPIIDD